MMSRCEWCMGSELMMRYHDTEWGVPLHDGRKLFEYMILDAFQAGLSWSTILNKRENFRKAFDDFDPGKIVRYNRKKISGLLSNPGIIRNRLKVAAAVVNARVFLDVQDEFGSFDAYLWRFLDDKPIRHEIRPVRSERR